MGDSIRQDSQITSSAERGSHERIYVRFQFWTIACLTEFRPSPYNGQRLSRQKTVVVSLKRYRPIFCRVPTAGQGMSKHACLALECQNFVVLGSYGEACFGDPVPIDDVEDLRLWSEGLRQDGGAGSAFLF